MNAYIDKIKELVTPLLENKVIDLVDLHIQRDRKKVTLKFLVDKPTGGISLEECVKLNEEIGQILENQDFIQESFVLEVSSPGLDRPLMTIKDFIRAINKDVIMFLKEKIQGKLELSGRVIAAKDNIIFLDIQGQQVEVPLEKINKAKYIF
ncbi:MAG TPA: ribosome maturation factor RimP [Candidatus Omnitrophota bacterium]|nr:ribosome maturation factor RimP [Candidatus Omnitrophota bacterium]